MTAQSEQRKGEASRRFGLYATDKNPFQERARRQSALTIPSLFREDGASGATQTVLPWSSIGAYGVNNLSAKLCLTWFPPGLSSIKIKPSKKAREAFYEIEDEEERGKLKAAVDRGLSMVEQELVDVKAEDGDRWRLFDVVRHLVVGGNMGLKMLDDDTLETIHLDNYVTVRQPNGKLAEFIVKNSLLWNLMSEDLQNFARENGYVEEREPGGNGAPKPNQAPVDVYTWGYFKRGKWTVHQEMCGEIIPGTEWTYNEDSLPYLFLRMVALQNEHYGRSYCEDYEGDLTTVDTFWQILTEGSAAIAQLKWLVRPGGSLNKDAFSKAGNGAVLTGDEADVVAVRAEKGGDLAVAKDMADATEARLQKVFVVNSSIQRSGERVTAYELSIMRQELETTLGGVYSNGVVSFQAPYDKLKLKRAMQHKRVRPLPKESITVAVITGDSGLGRLQASQGLNEMLDQAREMFGPEVVTEYVSISNYLEREAANRSQDTEGLIRSEETVQAERAKNQQAATLQQVAPEIVKQGGEMLQNNQLAAQQQEAPQ